MDIRPLHSEQDYTDALVEIERYFVDEPLPGTQEADRFDLLALVIADYEAKHWPVEPPDPVEAIKYRMEQGGYGQNDLSALFGSRSRACEVLARKRRITMEMAWKLNREWGIPAESLIRPYDLAP